MSATIHSPVNSNPWQFAGQETGIQSIIVSTETGLPGRWRAT
jgi:hypothetical protein